MDIDTTLCKGMSYQCLEGCGACCLARVEVLPPEQNRVQGEEDLEGGLQLSQEGVHLKSKGTGGACYFLTKRRCSVYNTRPHYCRQYPVPIMAGERLQAIPLLSCRGMWSLGSPFDPECQTEGGDDLAAHGLACQDRLGDKFFKRELNRTRGEMNRFRKAAKRNGYDLDLEPVTQLITDIIPSLCSLDGVSKVLFTSNIAVEDLDDIPSSAQIASMDKFPELKDLAAELARTSLEGDDMDDLPVFTDESFGWNIFQVLDDSINHAQMDEDGTTQMARSISINEVPLIDLDNSAKETMAKYLNLLLRRDSSWAGIYTQAISMEFEVPFWAICTNHFACIALELIWRANLLRTFGFTSSDMAREAIIYMDNDILEQSEFGVYL